MSSTTIIMIQAKLSVVASERDYAVTEMRRMAEECQNISAEFDRMASHSDQLLQELEQVMRGMAWNSVLSHCMERTLPA